LDYFRNINLKNYW